jgi:hypothetical protein
MPVRASWLLLQNPWPNADRVFLCTGAELRERELVGSKAGKALLGDARAVPLTVVHGRFEVGCPDANRAVVAVALAAAQVSFEEPGGGALMAGLHCCGDLTPTMLRTLVDPGVPLRGAVVVGCCYHGMALQQGTSADWFEGTPAHAVLYDHHQAVRARGPPPNGAKVPPGGGDGSSSSSSRSGARRVEPEANWPGLAAVDEAAFAHQPAYRATEPLFASFPMSNFLRDRLTASARTGKPRHDGFRRHRSGEGGGGKALTARAGPAA